MTKASPIQISPRMGWTLAGIAGIIAVHLTLVFSGTGLSIIRVDQALVVILLIAGGDRDRMIDSGFTPVEAPAIIVAATVSFLAVGALCALALWFLGGRGKREKPRSLAGARELKKRVGGTGRQRVVPPFARMGSQPIQIREEDTVLCVAPPRGGKDVNVAIPRTLDAPGACVVTSTKNDILAVTAAKRSAIGSVYVFDFDGISGWNDLARWDFVRGCEDPQQAMARAAAIVSARGRNGQRDSAHFIEGVKIILRSLLHAAALMPGGTMRDVIRWSQDFSSHEPAEVLRRFSPNGIIWARELDQWCREDAPETIGNTKTTLSRITSSMTDNRVLDLLCPVEDGAAPAAFDPNSFASSKDTVFCCVDDSRESSTAPIITALVSAIVDAAKRASQRTMIGRLDVPMTLVLNEVANVCPLPQLPNLMSDGGGRGIQPWVFTQSYSQLEERWGREGAKTIFEASAAKIIMGGLGDERFLESLSRLVGSHKVESISRNVQALGGQENRSYSDRDERRMRPEDIRRIRMGQALLLYRDVDAIVTFTPWFQRAEASDLERDRDLYLSNLLNGPTHD